MALNPFYNLSDFSEVQWSIYDIKTFGTVLYQTKLCCL